jgi:hypothetical protein
MVKKREPDDSIDSRLKGWRDLDSRWALIERRLQIEKAEPHDRAEDRGALGLTT